MCPDASRTTDAQHKDAHHTGFDHKDFLSQQQHVPGVYQMYDAAQQVLYVGKAKSLKKRLASYFQKTLAPKTRSLVHKIASIEVTVTANETEALLLEHNLIKKHRPPYNILLRDDKSYPYIFVATEHPFPRIDLHRGPKRQKGRYFGPYPSAGSVRESLHWLQKTFRVRQCSDAFFANRSRPCLQYQIKRCSGPCVQAEEATHYAEDVQHTLMFLEGREEKLLGDLADRMEQASETMDYEQAAVYRDQIAHLRHVRESQAIEAESDQSADVIAIHQQDEMTCVQVLTIRQGRVLGSRSYFPSNKLQEPEASVLASFLAQYYLGHDERSVPEHVIANVSLDADWQQLLGVLADRAQHAVTFHHKVRGHRLRWLELAARSAEQNLLARLNSQQNLQQRFEQLQELLALEALPERIECFDISHSSGEAAVASCVVFDLNGPLKSDYRRFNIDGITPGDDYAAMKQALMRRYARVQQEEGKLPDVLLIDGGKGQLSQAREVFEELQLHGICLLGIAKGSTRKAGFETLWIPDAKQQWHERQLDAHHGALHLLQQVRDEAHRFAITGHKQRRDKKRQVSTLEAIPGIGPKRRKELLRHFGGRAEVAKASVEDLQKVSGISRELAQSIYDALRN